MRSGIRSSQASFALGCALLLLASEGTRRAPALRALAARRAAPLVLLGVLGLLAPLLLLDLGLRPFIEPKTTLFVPDPELGWRPRPGARAEWGHVRVEINAKGLRGPEVGWTKPAGVFRVLYLGDSVTFGYGLERVEDTYPHLVGVDLEGRLGTPVDTVNSGVGGWSPWQQLGYLQREGLRYQPDLILVGFVLNDVTEKFSLTNFGGAEAGWQLDRTARSRLDAWLSRSALVSFARDGFATWRFGSDVFLGAQRYEAEEVQWLAAHARGERLRRAWAITFENLEAIFQVAAEQEIPAALVVFPFAFQLEDPIATSEPQAMLREFAQTRGIPLLDLLPGLAAAEDALFLDASHLSANGSRVTAAAIAEFLTARGLAVPGATASSE
jgi:lysophospholipase L1-like esterase